MIAKYVEQGAKNYSQIVELFENVRIELKDEIFQVITLSTQEMITPLNSLVMFLFNLPLDCLQAMN